jgi:hypothetical protein
MYASYNGCVLSVRCAVGSPRVVSDRFSDNRLSYSTCERIKAGFEVDAGKKQLGRRNAVTLPTRCLVERVNRTISSLDRLGRVAGISILKLKHLDRSNSFLSQKPRISILFAGW